MKPFIICKSFHFIFYLDTFISFNMLCQLSYIINFTIMWTEKIIWFASEAFIFLYETPEGGELHWSTDKVLQQLL